MNPRTEKYKTITFSLREDERELERHAMLRAVYDALS